MAVFFFKVVSLAVRTLARPLINWVSYYNRLRMQQSQNIFIISLRNRLVFLGQNFHYYNTLINRKIFRLNDKVPIKPLSEEKALERGAELISECIVYSILLTIPLYEIVKAYRSGNKKQQQKKEFLIKMQTDLRDYIEIQENLKESISQINKSTKNFTNKIYNI